MRIALQLFELAARARGLSFSSLALLLLAPLLAGAAEHHSLWSVQGSHNTVYLLGSVHLLKADEPLPAVMDDAYQKSKALVMEIDMDDIDPLEAQSTTLSLGMLPDDTTLQDEIGPQAFSELSTYAQHLGMDPAMFAHFRPWLVAITLEQYQLMKLGLNPETGVEQRFTARAIADHKEIRGLETLSEQLGYFASLSQEQETKYLLYTIEDAERTEQEFDQLLTAWRTGDTDRLAHTLDDGFHDFPELFKRLTVDRNRRWLGTMETLLHDNQNYLVIVGAFHLVGRDGLIDLLEHRGYRVTQQ